MIKRPWGGYAILKKTKTYWVKKLYIHPKARLSLQSHHHREEVWYILSGTIMAQIGTKKYPGKPGDLFIIPKKKKHRIMGVSKAVILEVAFGKTLETDIIRYEDDYGRV
jgi:mannose-6-phosphate isomerase-like protein (cupin superfamily)